MAPDDPNQPGTPAPAPAPAEAQPAQQPATEPAQQTPTAPAPTQQRVETSGAVWTERTPVPVPEAPRMETRPPLTAVAQDITQLSEGDAVSLIGRTTDRNRLAQWARIDPRRAVVEAINRQMDATRR